MNQKFLCNINHCSFYNRPKVSPEGNQNADYLILGLAPERNECEKNRPFVGASGVLLRNALHSVFGSAYPNKFYITNVIKCFLKAGSRIPLEVKELCIKNYLFKEIETIKPKVIIPLGEEALSVFFPNAGFSITDCVEVYFYSRQFNCWIVPNFHPSYLVRNPKDKGLYRRFLNALELAKKLGTTNFRPIDKPTKVYLFSEESQKKDILEFLEKVRQAKLFAFDIETYRQKPYYDDAEIACISFAFDNVCGSLLLDWLPNNREIVEKVKEILTDKESIKVGHNLLYESEWLYAKYGIVVEKPVADTMVLHHGLYSGRLELHGLKTILTCEYGVEDWSVEDIDDVKKVEKSKLLYYNALDSYYTLKLYERLMQKYKACEKLINRDERCRQRVIHKYYLDSILQPLIPYIGKAIAQGIVVSFDYLEQLRQNLITNIKKILVKIYTNEQLLSYHKQTADFINFVLEYDKSKLGDILITSLNIVDDVETDFVLPSEYYTPKSKRLKVKEVIFNINSNKQLAEFLNYLGYEVKKTEKGNPNLDAETLKEFSNVKVIKYLLELKTLLKKYSTYVKGSYKVVYKDGKFHPNFVIIGNNTSRFHTNKPNCQNFPKRKGKEMRNIFTSPEGYFIISADFANLEVRGEALLSNDKVLTDAVVDSKIDVHLYWAERLFGKEKAQEMRHKAKNGFVFPMLYRAGVKTLCEGVGWSLTEKNINKMKEIRDEFWRVHSGINNRHMKVLQCYEKNGEIYDITGRPRKAPINWNELVNYAIQSSCFWFTINAWYWILKQGWWSPFELHDELFLYVPEDKLKKAVNDIYFAMVIRNHKFFPIFEQSKVRLDIDMKKGKHFGSLEEFDWKSYLDNNYLKSLEIKEFGNENKNH